MNINCEQAVGFWKIGIQYLHLVQAVSNENNKQGNQLFITSDAPLTEKEYSEQTKWSDHNLVIPLLFNFYHGLEVLLKGFLASQGVSFKSSHKLSTLLLNFKKEFPKSELIPFFEQYILPKELPPVLSEFCDISSITIDDYYQSLKYSVSTKGNQFEHYPLKGKGEEGAKFFGQLAQDIETIRIKTVSLGRSICYAI